MSTVRPFFVLGAALLMGGCASLSNVQTADTLGKGNFQFGIEPGVLVAADASGTATTAPAWLPHIDVAARWGVTESIDLGVRGGLSLLEFQSKFLFTRPGDPRLAISLAPTLGGLVVNGQNKGVEGILNLGVPLLIGIKLGGNELVLGPRLQNLLLFSGDGVLYGGGVGCSLGYAWHITDRFGLMPEASIVVPVIGGAAFAQQFRAASVIDSGIAMFQFKLGVLIGRYRKSGVPLPAPPPPVPPAPPPDGTLSPPPLPPAI